MNEPGMKTTLLSFDGTKIASVASDVLDVLRQKTDGPAEGYAVLMVLVEGFEKQYGIRAAATFTSPKEKQ